MKDWKRITAAIVIAVIGTWVMVTQVSFDEPKAYHPVMFYSKTGQINRISKVFTDTVTPTTSNGYSIDISAAGFTSISSVNVIAARNTATATSVPNVAVKSRSTSAIVVNIIEGNASLINILGNNVLLGPSTAFASTSGLWLEVQVLGY